MLRFFYPLVTVLSVALIASTALPAEEPPKPADSAPFAIVELFTSEGCSSCPSAERVLARFVKQAQEEGTRVFPLAFHVDYWNSLGWQDPYSSAAHTARQQRYDEAFGQGVYTPQMIVNGQVVFVGSNRIHAQLMVEQALAVPAEAILNATVVREPASRTLNITYTATPLPPDAVLNLAVVERGLSQFIPRGENTGRTLHHENVVRAFETVPAQPEATVPLDVPKQVNLAEASLIAYLQDPTTMTILGAIEVKLEE